MLPWRGVSPALSPAAGRCAGPAWELPAAQGSSSLWRAACTTTFPCQSCPPVDHSIMRCHHQTLIFSPCLCLLPKEMVGSSQLCALLLLKTEPFSYLLLVSLFFPMVLYPLQKLFTTKSQQNLTANSVCACGNLCPWSPKEQCLPHTLPDRCSAQTCKMSSAHQWDL